MGVIEKQKKQLSVEDVKPGEVFVFQGQRYLALDADASLVLGQTLNLEPGSRWFVALSGESAMRAKWANRDEVVERIEGRSFKEHLKRVLESVAKRPPEPRPLLDQVPSKAQGMRESHRQEAKNIGADSYDLLNYDSLPTKADPRSQVEALRADRQWQINHHEAILRRIDRLILAIEDGKTVS